MNPGTVTSVVANAPLTLTNATTTPTLSLGVVGLANGGTGVTAAPAANQFLRGDGSGKWTAGAITASDLPTLSGGYVDLSSSQAISGTKTFASPIAGSVTGSAASFTGNLAGDVTGAQGSTLVAALRGRPLSTATPNGGDVLAFASGQWAPSSGGLSVNTGAGLSGGGSVPLGGSLTLTNTGVTSLAAGGGVTITATSGAITLGTSAGGDLSGTLAGATVAKLQGVNVANGTPASGQVLAYDGSKWAPTTPAATGVTSVSAGAGLAGGTITGAGTLSIGAGAVTNAMLASPYATLNTSGGLTGGGTLNLGGALTLGLASQGGDLSGAYGSTKVVALQGVGVGTALPSSGQVLTYDGSKWAPAAAPATGVTSVSAGAGLAGGTITVAGTLSIGAAAVTNAMLQSSSLTVTAGTGLSGGGAVALGGSVSVANTGILALTGSANIAVTSGQSPTLSLTGTIPVGNLPPLGGDVTGAPNAATVARLQGVNVATAAPAAGQVLAYDGTAGQWTPSTNSSAVLTTRKYYVVLIVRSASDCPSGYNAESLANLKGADNNFYSFISGAGLYLGGNAISYGQEYLYWRVNSTSVPATETICWFAYDTRGKPMTSVLLYGSAQTCPSGYYGIPTSHLNGNNGYGYLLSNANGMYLGYVDSWDYGGQTSRDGYAYRYWYSTYLNPGGSDGTACFKVMGVEQDPATRNGVFPVSLGVKGPSACPSGYTYLASTALANSAQANTYTYSQFTDALTSFGGLYTWGGSGENYMYEYWTWNENINYCFKFYPLTGKPYATVRALNGQSCPDATYLSVNVSDVNGWNANAYLQKTPYALYLGGLEGWTEQSYNEGYFTANITTNTNKLCYRLDNVSSWP